MKKRNQFLLTKTVGLFQKYPLFHIQSEIQNYKHQDL